MVFFWMPYVLGTTLLLVLGAWCAEWVTRRAGWPARAVWAVAFAGCVALAGAPAFLPSGPASGGGESGPPGIATSAVPPPAMVTMPETRASGVARAIGGYAYQTVVLPAGEPRAEGRYDPLLAVSAFWAVVSVALLLWIGLGHLALRRRARAWPTRVVAGREVRVSRGVGPAAVGIGRPWIVLPAWLLDLPPRDREIAVVHEEEHLRARDPLLLTAGLLIAVALPWNLPLWWAHRRLARAVELDCDGRVLQRGVEPRAYAELLVRTAELGQAPLIRSAVVPLSRGELEERVRRVLRTGSSADRRSGWRTAAAALAAVGMLAGALSVERPHRGMIPHAAVETAGEAFPSPGAMTRLAERAVAEGPEPMQGGVASGTARRPTLAPHPAPDGGAEPLRPRPPSLALAVAGPTAPPIRARQPAPWVSAQSAVGRRGALEGFVVDAATGLPLAGVGVRVEGLARPLFTDSLGRFRTPELRASDRQVHASRLGYRALADVRRMAPGDPQIFRLEPEPLLLEGVTVLVARLGRSTRVPGVRAYSREQLIGSAGRSLAQIALREFQGTRVHCPSGWESDCVQIRGRPLRVAVYVDDQPLSGGFAALDHLYATDMFHVAFHTDRAVVSAYTEAYIEQRALQALGL